MSLQIIDCEQGGYEWRNARAGIPTASEFATVMAVGKSGSPSLTRKTYMFKLAGERLTGEPMESFQNPHMERGKMMEEEARDLYSFAYNCDPERVGFIRNGNKGCSPDALIGKNGGLEIKTALPHIQIERLLKNELPPEHRAQVQGNIWIAEREFWDFVSYWPNLPLFSIRVFRDDGYIANLAGAVTQFNDELRDVVERVRRYGAPPPKPDLPTFIPVLAAG